MQSRRRDFDIITGQSSVPLNSSKRSYSYGDQLPKLQKTLLVDVAPRRLGNARDRNEFKYCYFEPKDIKTIKSNPQSPRHSVDSSMMNCVSTPYNILTHTRQIPTSKVRYSDLFSDNLPNLQKKSPLTSHLKHSLLFSPNYRPDYPQRQARHEFYRKSGGMFDDICENELRSIGKYFRKYK